MLSCIINLLQLTFSFYMFAIYGSIVQSYSYNSLYSITILAVFALVFLSVFSFLRGKLLRTAGLGLEEALSQDVLRHTVSGMSGPVKRAYQQGLADISTLRSFLSSDALYAIFDIPWAPFYLVLIFFFHPLLGTLAACGALVTLGLTLLQDYWTRDRLARANTLAQESRRFMDTMLKNSEVVNAMGMVDAVYTRFDEKNSEILSNQTQASRLAGLSQSSIKSIQILMNVLIYGVGAWLVLSEGFDPGLMIAASIIMGQAIAPFMRALFAAKTIVQARQAYHRLHKFSLFVANMPQKMPLPAPKGDLRAEHVSFALDGRLLLRDVSLHLEPGRFLGLIGPNGAGKTTLIRVLLGIWPAILGSVRLDDADIYRWDKEELGPYVGYLPQEVELFPATVADNIARLGDVRMEEIKHVCALAGIREMIEALPKGYDSVVAQEGGIMFSGGQRQRIGLARALYGSPRLLVLDEPNSNLDEAGEAMLRAALERLRAERTTTCIMITHKMSLLSIVDDILVLQSGQVKHCGPRDNVLAALAQATEQTTAQAKLPGTTASAGPTSSRTDTSQQP